MGWLQDWVTSIPPGQTWVFHQRMPKSFLLSQPFLLIQLFILNMIFFAERRVSQSGQHSPSFCISVAIGGREGLLFFFFLYLPLSGTPSECLLKFGITLCVKKIFLFLIFIRTLKRGHHRLAQDPFHSRTEAVCLPPPQPIWSLVSPHPLFLPRVFALEQPKHTHGTQAHMYLSET